MVDYLRYDKDSIFCACTSSWTWYVSIVW
jgi:hypothetical protein